MVKHVLMFQFKDELTKEERKTLLSGIKTELEQLPGKIDGLLELQVQTEKLDTSNVDFLLDSTVVDKDALAFYANHPDHVKVLNELIRPNIKTRMCIDYEK